MKNDSSIKFTPLKITIAVIISLILHLVFFTNFNFNQLFISKNTNQSDELEIFVTPKIKKPINQTKVQKQIEIETSEKKLSNNTLVKKEKEVKQAIMDDLSTNSKRIQNEEVVAPKKSIDKKKILSNLSQLDFNVKTQTQNENLRIKNISAKSPEYIYRLYFEAWKKKVERMGSMNYPEAAKINNSFSNLVMKVTINSNGLVHNIAIIKSSGNEDLDIAATDIVRNGSPYAPFSEQMKREVDQVNITRIWKFIEDQNFSTAQ
ncbi:TonB family protein [Methylophilaceae bacterium]|nr:TonB family protein [Methylophilaceae bacterium]